MLEKLKLKLELKNSKHGYVTIDLKLGLHFFQKRL